VTRRAGIEPPRQVFRSFLRARGIRQRFGAIGRTGSIAIVERSWRTLKDTLSLLSLKAMTRADLEQRLTTKLLHYAYLRPHQTLGRDPPADVYFGIRPAHDAAVPPPRGRPGQPSAGLGLVTAHLDPERRLPLLIPIAA
jgi:Integrase core domain